MRLWVTALVAGVLASLVVAGWPALAADGTVAAVGTSWQPNSVTIGIGEKVTWTNSGGGTHNVCVRAAGATTGCDEFRNGNPAPDWSGYVNDHVFDTAGTYQFICEFHGAIMSGSVTVGSGGGTTTTDTTTNTTPTQTQTQTTPTQTQTTPTQTTPTETQTQTETADTTRPAFTGRLKRRSSRKALIVELGSSEDATLQATVSRRAPRKRSFARVGSASVAVKAGRNVVKLPRKAAGRLRRGAYRVRLVLVDDAGNRSAARTLRFKLG